MEHMNNMMKIARIMVDELAYGSVGHDENKAAEYINCIATFIHFLVNVTEHKNNEIEDLLNTIKNKCEVTL
jgi:uncharacterized protein with PhoU and TrkA domain